MTDMSAVQEADPGQTLLDIYDETLPQVFAYLRRRCSLDDVEDLTAETFMAAVTSIDRGAVTEVTTAWLIGIARNKLVGHWRRA
ncbi:MAG: RNA polymerase sigma-70 factor (ECF subfamily) [Candidatus Poriferisodalaceae bacterium]|jgi:RNA polymerase sigma-70 factor (ECF subfamily)